MKALQNWFRTGVLILALMLASMVFSSLAARADHNTCNSGVICHRDPVNGWQTIIVPVDMIDFHLEAHGDKCGPCRLREPRR